MRAATFVLPGATLQVRLQDTFYLGKVRHCNRDGSCYELGVELIEFKDPTKLLD